jgi:hypothetical protein
MTDGDSTVIFRRAYRYLRSGRAILDQLITQIPTDLSSLSPEEQVIISKHSTILHSLLTCNFGELWGNIDIAKDTLVPFIIRDTFLPIIQSIHSSLVSLVRGFSLLEPFLTVRFEELPQPPSPLSPLPQPSLDHDDRFILCRICECYVPLSMLEVHSQSCQVAYQTRSNVDSINVRIDHLQNLIAITKLNHPWPGDEPLAISHDLPWIRVVTILEQIQSIDPESQNASEILSLMATTLETLTIQGYSGDIITYGCNLAREKIAECKRMSQAQAQQRRTLVNQTISDHVTTLADFVFLKRISSGAYARVFLARKEKTGDIYAIKVTPVSSIRQKNALKRILSERDILLNFGSEFIVNFCIFDLKF